MEAYADTRNWSAVVSDHRETKADGQNEDLRSCRVEKCLPPAEESADLTPYQTIRIVAKERIQVLPHCVEEAEILSEVGC